MKEDSPEHIPRIETARDALTDIVEQNKNRPTSKSNSDLISKVGHPVGKFKASMKPPITFPRSLPSKMPEIVLQQFAAAQM